MSSTSSKLHQRALIKVFALVGIAVAIVALWKVNTVPAGTLTVMRMNLIKDRLLLTYEKDRKIPDRLGSLVKVYGRDNQIVDAWGNEIALRIDSANVATLSSYGRDGRPGGVGEDADVAVVFKIYLLGENREEMRGPKSP